MQIILIFGLSSMVKLYKIAIRRILFLISKNTWYISQFMTLLPGDVISTGTPSGVGLG